MHSTGDPSLPRKVRPCRGRSTRIVDRSRLQNWNQWLGFFARPAASAGLGQRDRSSPSGRHRAHLPAHRSRRAAKASRMGWRNPIGAGNGPTTIRITRNCTADSRPRSGTALSIGAHQAIEWEETWYPLAGLTRSHHGDERSGVVSPSRPDRDLNGRLDVIAYSTRPRDHARAGGLLARPLRRGCWMRLATLMTPATVLTVTPDVQVPLPNRMWRRSPPGRSTTAAVQITNDGQPPTTWHHGCGCQLTCTQPEIPVDLRGRRIQTAYVRSTCR